ncbi:MAG: hypothetical protein MJ131_07930 [Lachnospiraceae bacterium]|nr:hypothetical protein [Lachnospiraceae bacterium]
MKVRRYLGIFICLTIILASVASAGNAEAATIRKSLGLQQAKSLALANSSKYAKLQSKIALKTVAVDSAIKALKAKIKTKTTFTWSPLLSFHFPEQLTLQEASDGELKPLFLMNEITSLKHQQADSVFETYEKISNLYVECYTLQETIKFQEKQLELLQTSLERNKARVSTGTGSAQDVKSIEKSIKNMNTSLAANKRKFEQKKKKVSDLINLDVSTGYRFIDPYVVTEIPRKALNDIVKYTKEYDQGLYDAKMTTAQVLVELKTNKSLMEKQYGWKMNLINGYINQVLLGQRVDSNAFKSSFDKFVQLIDEPWQGKKRILFIKVPKEWFKGNIDGVRYIEDEPYILYENALDYQDALKEQKDTEKELEEQVRDSYETLVSARNSYLGLVDELADKQAELEQMLVLNALGQCTFEEYSDVDEQYKEIQTSMKEALATYSTLIYSFDRLTCGAVTMYINTGGINLDATPGAGSYKVEAGDEITGPQYYITPIIENNMFRFGISIPDDCDLSVSHYELYVNDTLIGEKTEIDKSISHLTFITQSTPKAFVRLYDGDKTIADCTIDTTKYAGSLDIPGEYVVTPTSEETEVGTFTTATDSSGLMVISMNFDEKEGVAAYRVTDEEGKAVLNDKKIAAGTNFKYLGLLSGSIDKLVVKCYDASGELLFDAYLDSTRNTIIKKV